MMCYNSSAVVATCERNNFTRS